MKIISLGIREGLLYQRTTVYVPTITHSMRKEAYHLLKGIESCPLEKWIELQDWSWVTSPEQKDMAIQSQIEWRKYMPEELESYRCRYNWIVAYEDPHEREGDFRYGRIYPYIEEDDLDTAIDEAAAVFADNAVIRTLEKPRFGQICSDRLREYSAPEGVLQYFKKEYRRRRQKFIEEID